MVEISNGRSTSFFTITIQDTIIASWVMIVNTEQNLRPNYINTNYMQNALIVDPEGGPHQHPNHGF